MFWLNTRFFFPWTTVCGIWLILSDLNIKYSAIFSLPPAFFGMYSMYVWCVHTWLCTWRPQVELLATLLFVTACLTEPGSH